MSSNDAQLQPPPSNLLVDLRSDTVTRPTPEMLQVMASAPTGDDVFGEDPTLARLEARCAEMMGHEAGLFCPSGTMTNQVAIQVHTRPGDEVVCDRLSHIYNYEGGGIARNSGASVKLLARHLVNDPARPGIALGVGIPFSLWMALPLLAWTVGPMMGGLGATVTAVQALRGHASSSSARGTRVPPETV